MTLKLSFKIILPVGLDIIWKTKYELNIFKLFLNSYEKFLGKKSKIFNHLI